MIDAAAGRTEKERKIPADVLSAMHACGLFHMLLPVSLGGAAVDLVTFNQVRAALASSCGTTGFSKSPLKTSEISAHSHCNVWTLCAYVRTRHGINGADLLRTQGTW